MCVTYIDSFALQRISPEIMEIRSGIRNCNFHNDFHSIGGWTGISCLDMLLNL